MKINHDSNIPKYKQVEELIVSDIESGILRKGQRIPSINETSEELLLARDTVEKAYLNLKKKGILSSVRGKGYYVNQVLISKYLKVALIFNKLSNYKRNIYYSFVKTLGNKASVDVFIYNFDLEQFENIIDSQINSYDYYVILPHFKNENDDVAGVIRKIPKEKVLIVDRNLGSLKDYPVVYQEYQADIQKALTEGIDLIRKYKKINLVFPLFEYYSKFILRGFQIFCQINKLEYSVVNDLKERDVKKNNAYVTISDKDLYRLIKICRTKNWKPGKDVGVVAYNDDPVKEILENGITTISTNHDEIGRRAAEMILTRNFTRIKSPFDLIKRNSL
ncbi:MAG: GntR family transcriptional regulator [Prolixibacteraceae bacterium]